MWGEGTLTVRLWDNQRWETREHLHQWQGISLFGGPTVSAVAQEAPLLFSLEKGPIAVVPIQLREQTSYRVEVSWVGERETPVLDCFPALSPPVLRPDPGWHRPRVFSGTLNFRDYVGETALVLHHQDREIFRAVLEVRSLKMGYLDDYVALLDSLGERLLALLLQLESPVFAPFVGRQGEQETAGHELFLLLRHLVRWPPLQLAWEHLRRVSPQQLTRSRRLVPVERHPPRHGRDLVDGYQRRNSWVEAPTTWTLPKAARGLVPKHYPKHGLELQRDTPENRFVGLFHQRVSMLLDSLSQRYGKSGHWALREELRQLQHEWMRIPRWIPVVDKASSASGVPVPRQSLATQPLYRPFLEAWDLLSASLHLSWSGLAEAIAGPLRDLARLYEYWCFFQLWEALCVVAEPDKPVPPWWVQDQQRLRADLRPGVGFPFRFKHLQLLLFYQRRFTPGESNMRSYSVALVPDYTLEIRFPNRAPLLLCFDAKYRPDKALEKMHAYRDALRGALGCYLFYPGQQEYPTLYPKNPESLLPGVGAFALRPHPESHAWLVRFLRWALEQIVSDFPE